MLPSLINKPLFLKKNPLPILSLPRRTCKFQVCLLVLPLSFQDNKTTTSTEWECTTTTLPQLAVDLLESTLQLVLSWLVLESSHNSSSSLPRLVEFHHNLVLRQVPLLKAFLKEVVFMATMLQLLRLETHLMLEMLLLMLTLATPMLLPLAHQVCPQACLACPHTTQLYTMASNHSILDSTREVWDTTMAMEPSLVAFKEVLAINK